MSKCRQFHNLKKEIRESQMHYFPGTCDRHTMKSTKEAHSAEKILLL